MPPPGATQRAASKYLVFEEFQKLNTKSLRQALSEKELSALQNLQQIAPPHLATIPQAGPSLPVLPAIHENITSLFGAPIDGIDYLFAFTDQGAGWAINIANGASKQFAPDGTFSTQSGGVGGPDLTDWQELRVLINDTKSGYCTFDGNVFTQQGGVSPVFVVSNGGSGYTSPPTVAILGGSNQPTLTTSSGTPAGGQVLNFASTTGVVDGGSVADNTAADAGAIPPGTIVLGHTATTVILSAAVLAPGVGNSPGPASITFGTAAAHSVITGGQVTSIILDKPGIGYLPGDMLTITFGTGAGSGATASITMSGSGIISIALATVGSGYNPSATATVTISGGGGVGGTAYALISLPLPHGVASINVITAGSSYTSPPTVTVNANPTGSGGTGTALLNQSVASIALGAGGSGYTSPPAVVFTGGGGSGAAAHTTLVATTIASVVVDTPGVGYTSPPTVGFSGGGGSGAAATATLSGTGVATITVTNPGSGYTTLPTVTLTGGGGTGATAHAVLTPAAVGTVVLDSAGSGYQVAPSVTISTGSGAAASAHPWPTVPSGTTLAVFQGRVWLGGGTQLQWTGTQGFDDFNPANASGALLIVDADLVHRITALRSLNNYLFIMGDSSVKQIGNISLGGANLNITVFTIITLSSDQGTVWPLSCDSFNRVFMFANWNGIYAVLGTSVQKISDDLDGVWKLIDFSQQPQAAIADINRIHNICWLVRYRDPVAGTRSVLFVFDGKRWYFATQSSNSLIAITAASLLGSGWNTYGTSPLGVVAPPGTADLTPFFAMPNATVTFNLSTALSHHGNATQRKKIIRAGFVANYTGPVPANVSVVIETNEGTQTYQRTMTLQGIQVPQGFSVDGAGRYLGMTIAGNLANFTLVNCELEYQETTMWG